MSFKDEKPKDKTIVASHKLLKEAKESESRKMPFVTLLQGSNAGQTMPVTENFTIGRDEANDLPIVDDGASRKHARMTVSTDGKVFIEDLGSTNGTFVNGRQTSGKEELQDGDKILIGDTTTLKFVFQDTMEEQFQKTLYMSATRDSLTGIYNKKYFFEELGRNVNHHQRMQLPLSLILFDIDHFKNVNDTYGHPAGDAVLKTVARVVGSAIRKENTFCRYGGEEFVIILANTNLEKALVLAERIRDLVANAPANHEDLNIKVTVSLGVAELNAAANNAQDLIAATDKQLYLAKKQGRNRVCYAS